MPPSPLLFVTPPPITLMQLLLLSSPPFRTHTYNSTDIDYEKNLNSNFFSPKNYKNKIKFVQVEQPKVYLGSFSVAVKYRKISNIGSNEWDSYKQTSFGCEGFY